MMSSATQSEQSHLIIDDSVVNDLFDIPLTSTKVVKILSSVVHYDAAEKSLYVGKDKIDLDNNVQTLSLSGSNLSISGGNTVNFAGWDTNVADDVRKLSELGDISVSNPTTGQVLKYRNGIWVNDVDNDTLGRLSCNINQILQWNGSAWMCVSPSASSSDTLQSLSCANGQVAKWNGTSWMCSNDENSSTTYSAGTGLTLSGTTFSLNAGIDLLTDVDTSTTSPNNGQVLKWTGGNWVPGDDNDDQQLSISNHTISLVNGGSVTVPDNDTLATLSCSNGEIAKWNGSSWICANDDTGTALPSGTTVGSITTWDGTSWIENANFIVDSTGNVTNGVWQGSPIDISSYTNLSAGNGLQLTGDSISINSPTCNGTDKLQWNGTAFVCSADQDTTYSAGSGLSLSGTTFSLNAGIDLLTDVDTSSNPPTNNQVLSWNGTNWISSSVSSLETNTTISNTISGHKIADYTNEAGSDTPINETVTGLSNLISGHKIGDYTDENGNTTSFYESLTSLALNGNSLDYTDEAGNTTNIDLSGYDKNIYNGDGSLNAERTVNLNGYNLLFVGGGNIGIGTSSPGAILHVENTSDPTVLIEDVDGGNPRLELKGSQSAGMYVTGGNGNLYLFTDTGDKLRINDTYGTLQFLHDAASLQSISNPHIYRVGDDLLLASRTNSGAGAIRFITYDGTSGAAERVKIDSNGNVGIGTSTPAAKLEVIGDIRLSGAFEDKDGDIGSSGQVLSSTGTATDWVDVSSLSLGSINQHSDVDTSTNVPANGQVLKWDGSNWVPQNDSDTDTLGSLSCLNGEIAKWNGSAWVCSADEDTDTTYSAGNGLQLSGTTFSINSPTCNGTDKLQWNGTAFVCSADQDTTYSAGTGLQLSGTTFSLNAGIDLLTDVDTSTNSPGNGQVLKWDGSNWVPQNDIDTTYTAGGTLLQLTGTSFSLKEGTLTNGYLCTYDSANGLVCNTDSASVGTNYWSRSGTTLSPATAGDDIVLTSGEDLSINDLTPNGIIFAGASGLISEDKDYFSWDDSSKALQVGRSEDNVASLTLYGSSNQRENHLLSESDYTFNNNFVDLRITDNSTHSSRAINVISAPHADSGVTTSTTTTEASLWVHNAVGLGDPNEGTIERIEGAHIVAGSRNSSNSGTLNNVHVLWLEPENFGGTIDNMYTLYLSEMSSTAGTTNNYWAVYQKDQNTKNYFAAYTGLGVESPTYRLELPNDTSSNNGRARAVQWATYSDSRIKTNQQAIQYGLNELLQLKPKSYEQHSSSFRNGNLVVDQDHYFHTIGLVAQEVYGVIPEAVYKPTNENTNLWSLDYEKLVPVIIQSIKDLNTKVDNISNGHTPNNSSKSDNYWKLIKGVLKTSYDVVIKKLTATIINTQELKTQLLNVADKVLIDRSGVLTVKGKAQFLDTTTIKKLETNELQVVNNTGTVVIPAGQTSITVKHAYNKGQYTVFVTPLSQSGAQYWVSLGDKSFTINIKQPNSTDISFNYLIVISGSSSSL